MIAKLDNIVKRYGNHLALDCVDIQISEGEILGLLGPNGAGKTTLIHGMIGLISVDSGEITIFGKDLKKHALEIKRQIGLVTQEVTIFEELSAWDNLAFFGGIYGIRGDELKKNIEETLEIVGLTEYKNKLPAKFSGGMKRRLNIACALVHKPKFLVMDEPTVGIDAQSRNYILETVRRLNGEGTTVLYTTHYIEEVEAISSRVAILDQGRVIAQGTKKELIQKIQYEERITLQLVESGEEVIEEIQKLSGVKEAYQQGREVRIISEVGAGNIENILTISKKHGGVQNINTEQPTLEDVFLTLTGKQLRDGEVE
ncbi:ATP-binding cassette domain-containing protein [Alkalibaculum sp. M08DMB]|uniref:ATP-binding cassette domain-containing protein n=1 Tax=Alkalibaculum sporogenes TaxID=2655001 RepID=A0A6A7K7W7_9FIRM|nr:ABC transporter ATP-binding protein [Alkalibaculum sporogenes]MPW25452.1 ATP-binding cassette domain-containing protein [Alkalibaculum sporogenes]